MSKRKILSIIVALVLMLTTFTSCGTTELGYLNMLKDVSSMEKYSLDSKVSMVLGEGMSEYKLGFNQVNLDLRGFVDSSSIKDSYMDYTMTVVIDNKTNGAPIVHFIMNSKGFLVSKASVLDTLTYLDTIGAKGFDNKAKQIEMLKEKLAGIDYLEMSTLGQANTLPATYPTSVNAKEINALTYGYMEKAFKGFETQAITRLSSDSYKLEVTSDNMIPILKNTSAFVKANKETIFNESVTYLIQLYKIMGITDDSKESKEIVSAITNSKTEFNKFVDGADMMLTSNSAIIDTYKNRINGSKFTDVLSKIGDAYYEKTDVIGMFDGKNYFTSTSNINFHKVDSVSKINLADVKTADFKDTLDSYEKIDYIVNPVKKVTLSWERGTEADSFADAEGIRGDKSEFSDFYNYKIIDSRIYLPLRDICESFGETVGWDNATHNAYIVRDGKKILMTGIVSDGTTFVKVRDFEKLGYKIDYTQDKELSTATITK